MQDVEMSGALPDNTPVSQSTGTPTVQPSNDHVFPREDVIGPGSSEFPEARPQRHQSFVASDARLDTAGNILPLERIDIGPTQRRATSSVENGKKSRKTRMKQSSLDAILQHAVNRLVVHSPETQIPLPESEATSVSSLTQPDREIASRRSIEGQPKSSLDVIAEKGSPIPSIPSPSSVPLPESRPESLEEARSQQPYEQQDFERHQRPFLPRGPPPSPPGGLPYLPLFNYDQVIERATEVLQHLSNGRILSQSRHEVLNISCMDFSHGYRSYPVVYLTADSDEDVITSLGDIEGNVKQRLIIVEDLSPRIINCLGRRFGVNPELFEEHLLNSGYDGAEYNDAPAHTWTTFGRKKSYISLRWYRPVLRLPIVPYSTQDLKDLLDPEVARLEYTSDISNDLSIFQTETNIFRSAWDLWTDPRTTTRMKRICGWEEKVSIWTQKLPDRDCQIVIVLLDPLPKLGEGIERDVVTTRVIHHLDLDDGSGRSESLRSASMIHMTDAEALDRLAEHMKERHVAQKQLTRIQRFMQRITFTNQPEDDTTELRQTFEFLKTKTFKKARSRSVFEQIASRARIDVGFEDAFQSPDLLDILRRQLYETRSTTDEFCQRVETAENDAVSIDLAVVAQPLFQIIRKDTTNLLKVLHNALDEINVDILDDVKMEESLSIWRELITRAQLELPEMKRSMVRFFSFLQVLDSTALISAPNSRPARALDDSEDGDIPRGFEDLSKQINDMLQRLQIASSSLTSNMALLDSRRSISEAQAVTKLTELAFFFIPLTFAATIFGMQIEQFENRAQLSTFIVLGISFTACSYLVRLMIRSMWLRSAMQAYRQSIKIYADKKRQPVQRGYVPASLFLSWIGYELRLAVRHGAAWLMRVMETIGKLLGSFWEATEFIVINCILVSVVAAAPIAVLWTRQMDRGIQGLITVVILVCVIGLVAVPYWRYGDPETRRALPRLLKKRFKRFQVEDSKLVVLLIWICALAIAVVPLAVIWTRPVAPGIKAAITVFVILVVVLGGISYGIFRLVSIARMSASSSGSSSGSRSPVD